MAVRVLNASTIPNVSSGNITMTFTGIEPALGNVIVVTAIAIGTATGTYTDDATGGSNTYTSQHNQSNAASGFNDARAQAASAPVLRSLSGLVVTGVHTSNTGFAGCALEVSGLASSTKDISSGSDLDTSPTSTSTGAMQDSGELIIGCHHHMPDTPSGSKTLAFGTWTPAANNYPTQIFLLDDVGAAGCYGIAGYTISNFKSTTATVFTFSPNPVANTSPQYSIAYLRGGYQFGQGGFRNSRLSWNSTLRPAIFTPGYTK
jgi:hypothetical protein